RDGFVRRLLKPLVLAKLIDVAQVEPGDLVLDLACATGYSSAVLAHLAAAVVAVEEEDALAERARATLRDLQLNNVTVRTAPLEGGSAADGPYDVILINGAVEILPDSLGAQLKDGGRLVCVQRHGPVGRGMLYLSSAGGLSGRSVFDAAAPLLPGFVEPPAFVF
ncbi:MAG TPA: methyltransferase domain-containing protein, partial [Xanthobacteraceae bacterium]|nr:methyltransferase domain-containing protein [Xanthobacteraceae bacterium]